MAGNVGDVMRVTVRAEISTSQFLNVFFYRLEDVPTATYLEGLLTEFQTVVLSKIAALEYTDYVFNGVVAENIFSGDILEDVTPTPAAGTRTATGDRLAYFNAGMILLPRQNARVRHGRKFMYLGYEQDAQGNQIASGTLTLLGNLAAVLDDVLAPGLTDNFAPVIVGRIAYTSPSGRTAYRLPTSQAEMGENWSYISTPRVINRCTTMNSRKQGRGS